MQTVPGIYAASVETTQQPAADVNGKESDLQPLECSAFVRDRERSLGHRSRSSLPTVKAIFNQ